MISINGCASSLKEVGERFLDFVQTDNSTTVAWEVVDDRLDSFYGATIKFPVDNYYDEESTDYAYISLQFNTITNTTYRDWLFNSDSYMSENFDHRTTINNGEIFSDYYDNYYTREFIGVNSTPNIFADTGQILFISPHLTFDKNIWMCEQGGIACEQEALSQTISDNCSPIRTIIHPRTGNSYEQSPIKFPPFPSLGCPMFTISDTNLSECHNAISYYFTRDNSSANIVIYINKDNVDTCDIIGNIKCQHMSFGRLDSYDIDKEFKYPLYVAGGNGAMQQHMYVYTKLNGSYPTYMAHNIYTLDMENIALSNSNLLCACKFNGSEVSNFRVLCSDGTWENVFNTVQNATVTNPHLETGQIQKDWYYPLTSPTVGMSSLSSTLESTSDNRGRVDTHTITESLSPSIAEVSVGSEYISSISTPINPINVLINNDSTSKYYGIVGSIPNCYSSWSRTLSFGELTYGNNKYLCIPNGWSSRLWYYPSNIGVKGTWKNSDLKNNMENVINRQYNNAYNNLIQEYVLVLLSDTEESSGE